MRITFWLLIPLLALTACKPTQNGNGNGNGGGDKTYTVSGRLTTTAAYCGGAAPSHEILERLATPKPLADFTLHVRTGTTNELQKRTLQTTKTDAEGNFSFKLSPGEYCIIIDERLKMPDPQNANFGSYVKYDADCTRDWIQNCDFQVTVAESDVTGLSHNFGIRCFIKGFNPCLQYDGPLPP